MLNEKIKIKIATQIESFKNRLRKESAEIADLDKQLGLKRADFLRVEGAIKGLEMALDGLNVEDEDVQGESEDKE